MLYPDLAIISYFIQNKEDCFEYSFAGNHSKMSIANIHAA